MIRQFDLATGEIKTIISTDTGGWGLNEGILFYTNWNDSGRLYACNTRDGSTGVLAADGNTLPVALTGEGIFYEVFNDDGEPEDLFFIRYDAQGKTDLWQE